MVETDPEVAGTFVFDGLNTHKYESLVQFVAQKCGQAEDLGCKGRSGILKSLENCGEFLHREYHKIYIVYTPRYCSDESPPSQKEEL